MLKMKTMKTIKKITLLLMVTAFSYSNTYAQAALSTNQKIVITNYKVYEKDAQVFIDWQTNGAVAANYWQVQYSTDGQQFTTMAIVFGPDPKQPGDCYKYKGKIRMEAGKKVTYRVRPVDSREEEIITEIVTSAK